MTNWMLPALFLLSPFALLAPGLIWKAQQLFLIICPLFILAAVLRNQWIKFFLLYAGAWQIAIFLVYFRDVKGPGPGGGLSVILCLIAAACIYKYVSEGKLSQDRWFTVLRIAVLIQLGIATSQFFGFNAVAYFFGLFFPIKEYLPNHLVGSLGNRNYLAVYMAMTIPMFIGWHKGIVLPFIALYLILSPSPASLAAILGGAFYFSYTRWGKPKEILFSLGLATVFSGMFTAIYVLSTGYHLWEFQALPRQLHLFFTTGNASNDVFQGDLGRFGMWITAASLMVKTIPGTILGFGPGAYWGRDYPLHSEYVMTLFYFGLIGLFMVLGYIYTTWRFLWQSKNVVLMTAFMIICIDCVANFPFEIATTGFMGMIILGLIERERINYAKLQDF